MNKVSQYSYSELNPHQEEKLYLSCFVEDIEGFTIELDADKQSVKIIFN